MGLKQMVEQAMKEAGKADKPPFQISGDAVAAMSNYIRKWSGIPDATLVFGEPGSISPYASFDSVNNVFTANPETLILNPHRVLFTVTPFRLRQEAVLTGCLLHEAGHARHSTWLPRKPGDPAPKHGDGTEVHQPTLALARLIEEARIEGIVAAESDRIGARGLDWTMRAAAAYHLPPTALSRDPEQQIMDLVESWTLRAGRQYALAHHTTHEPKGWVQDFTTLLSGAIEKHLDGIEQDPSSTARAIDPSGDARAIIGMLIEAVSVGEYGDTGSFMVDQAKGILSLLFPETDSQFQPEPQGGGCSGDSEDEADPEDTDGESDDDGEQGEGNTEPEDEGSGDDPGAGDSGDDEADEDEDDEEGEEGDGNSAEAEADSPGQELADALAELEAASKADTEEEGEAQASAPPPSGDGETEGGAGQSGNTRKEDWRAPTMEEREVQRNAERFLRSLIEPSESSKVALTDTPAATVDGAALAAWRAGGQVRAPQFFKRTRRATEPSPPIKIAVLVDVSFSMAVLQKPSALLSWALASAALDLRNFAGRGQQIESVLIHWGDDAKVIQKPGEFVPGISTVSCDDGTHAMHKAYALVEETIPGFFDPAPTTGAGSANRLLVHFTDWEISQRGGVDIEAVEFSKRLLQAGVNMVTVAPQSYGKHGNRWNCLPRVTEGLKGQRGTCSLIKYNPMFPEQVWETAAEALA